MKALILLLLSFLPSGQETIVYIDEVSIQNKVVTVNYRINDLPAQTVSQKYNDIESIVKLPGTTVRVGWSWEWVFNEYEWVVDYEPNTKVIWTY